MERPGRPQTATRFLAECYEDVRYGLRQLRRNPGFAAVALVTLALGIGVNTAMFGVVEGVLLRPLPYPHPEELVDIAHTAPGLGLPDVGMSASMYFVYRQHNRTFTDVGIYADEDATVTGGAEPERVAALDVSDGVLPILDVPPLVGREFTRADGQLGSPLTAMLTYGFWKRAYGGDRAIVDQTITVDGVPRVIIGVLPKSFRFLDEPTPELLLPIQLRRATTTLGDFEYSGLARLKPGVTVTEANADVARMQPIVDRTFPPPARFTLAMYESGRITPNLRPLKSRVVGNAGEALWILMGGIGLVLLIACANMANLLTVRLEGRRQELETRAALGAEPGRIVRQILLESLTLGLLGGAAGLGFAAAALRLLLRLAPANLPRLSDIGIDGTVLLFTLAASVLASLACGSIPALKFERARARTGLRGGGRGMSTGRERNRARNALAMTQLALAVVLLIGSGLMLRTSRALFAVKPGYRAAPDTIQTFRTFIPGATVQGPDATMHMEQNVLEKLRTTLGVTAAAIADMAPMESQVVKLPILRRDRIYARAELAPFQGIRLVSPEYFKTLGIPLVAGRTFTWSDIYGRIPVVTISANLARKFWGTPRQALGQQIRVGAQDAWHQIVGVVGDVHDDGVNEPAPMETYWPIMTANFQSRPVIVLPDVAYLIRSPRAGSASFIREARRAVWAVNPALPLANVHTLEYFYRRSMARTSFLLAMLAVAGGMAVLLGVIGLYDVISYVVAQRTREFGIRMALGAHPGNVMRLVVMGGLRLALYGIGIGAAVALVLARFLASLLYGVNPADPMTFIAVAAGLAAVALLASYFPARRATMVDPAVALRSE